MTETFQQNIEIIHGIIDKFKNKKGFVMWKDAYKQHPEWKESLGIKNRTDQQKLYLFVNDLKRRGELSSSPKKRVVKSKPKTEIVVRNNEETEIRAEGLTHVRFCPVCSANLEAVDMALRLSNRGR